MAVRRLGAGGPVSAKVSAIFAGATLLLAPAMNCTAAKETVSRRVEEPSQSVFTNGVTTIRISGGSVRVESMERGSFWSVEAAVKGTREIAGIKMLTIDLGTAALEGITNPMGAAAPADALTADNMRDAGAPEEEVSIIIVPDLGGGAAMRVRMAHELTHALISRHVEGAGRGRLSRTANEAIAYAAQIAFGDARAGVEDVLGNVRSPDRDTERVARGLIGELAAFLGKDPRRASGDELRGAASAFLDKICMYEFGAPFAQMVDVSLYSSLE